MSNEAAEREGVELALRRTRQIAEDSWTNIKWENKHKYA